MEYEQSCVFCVAGRDSSPTDGVWRRDYPVFRTFAIEPLDPVVLGHVLFIPYDHVRDASERPELTGQVMAAAAQYIRYTLRPSLDANIITSIGAAATQTVFHFHVHVVPRYDGDGLNLPWS